MREASLRRNDDDDDEARPRLGESKWVNVRTKTLFGGEKCFSFAAAAAAAAEKGRLLRRRAIRGETTTTMRILFAAAYLLQRSLRSISRLPDAAASLFGAA